MSRVKDGNYVVIQSFMVKELELKGNELMAYAIIYGFSQDGQRFSGSLQYLADWMNCTKQSVINNLKSLCNKGLIEKFEIERNGIKFCEYQSKMITAIKEILPPSQKIIPGGSQNSLTGGSQKIIPNNISSNNLIKDNQVDMYRGRFVPPSVDDVRAYCQERNNSVDPERFVDYYTSNGWMVGKNRMKDWKASVRTWERRDKQSAQRQEEEGNPFLEILREEQERKYGSGRDSEDYVTV